MLTTSATELIIDYMTDWLTVKEAAEKTGYNAQYIRRLCRLGKLDAVLKGRLYLINPKDLDTYIKKMKSLGTYKHDWRRKYD